ncbi:MAG: hypothetical protein WC080_01455 [Patescibacteria group bacterium]|jgi:predicted phage tail protein
MKYLIFIALILFGYLLIKYAKWITDNTMRFPSVEKVLGAYGTYTFWKIVGVLVIVAAFWYVVKF